MVPKEEAVSLLQRVLRADTVNPPGNELETALILRDFFDAHGVEAEWTSSCPDGPTLSRGCPGTAHTGDH